MAPTTVVLVEIGTINPGLVRRESNLKLQIQFVKRIFRDPKSADQLFGLAVANRNRQVRVRNFVG